MRNGDSRQRVAPERLRVRAVSSLFSSLPHGALYPHQRNDKTRIVGRERLAPRRHTIVFDFVYDGGGAGKGGTGTLSVDGAKAAEGRIAQTTPIPKFSLDESFDVGQDTGTPVIDEYDTQMPFRFTGTLERPDPSASPATGAGGDQ